MPKPAKEIAPRLRALRDAVDMTVEELADQTESSVEDVLRFESGDHEIPVSYLFKVAQALRVDTTVLISGGEAHLKTASMVKKGEGLAVERRADYDYKSLAYRFTGRKMEPFLITVAPKTREEMNFNTHAGQEFIFLLEGRLELIIGERTLTMEPEDSVYFDSTAPHAMRALDGKPARFLDVII